MKFDSADGQEWVRPTENRKGYWRRAADHSNPTEAQKHNREAFKEKAKATKGKTGVVILPDGRQIAQTAYEMMKKERMEQDPAPMETGKKIPRAAPELPAPQMNAVTRQTGAEAAKPRITPVMQAPEGRQRISVQDIIDARELVAAVNSGKISHEQALLRMLQKW